MKIYRMTLTVFNITNLELNNQTTLLFLIHSSQIETVNLYVRLPLFV